MSLTAPLAGLGQSILRSRTLAALASPHGVDRYLEQVNPMWAAHEVRARVVDIRRETAGIDTAPVATLTLQPTSSWRGHRAGQYVQVGVDLPGSAKRLTRCFSISSAASAPGSLLGSSSERSERIEITIRAHDEGQVSKFLVNHAQPGQMLHLSQAEGDFTLPGSPSTPSPYPLVFITGGSGITPAMAMIRTLLRDGYDGKAGRKVTFLHFARSPEDQIFAEELAAIADADNDIEVHLRYGDQIFSEFELRRLVPDYRTTDTWACGPGAMVDLIQAAYAGSDRLRLEFFKPPRTSRGTAEGEVAFSRTGRSAANTGESLLEQAEALGLKPEFGCRMGICFSCVTTKTEGTVRNILTGEESSLPDEDIRICVSAPQGDCTVDL